MLVHLHVTYGCFCTMRAEQSSCNRDLMADEAKNIWPFKKKLAGAQSSSFKSDPLLGSCTLNFVSEGFFLIAILETVLLIYPVKTFLEPCRKNISIPEKAVHTKIPHRQLVGLISNICCLFVSNLMFIKKQQTQPAVLCVCHSSSL